MWLAKDTMTISVFDLFKVGIGPSSSHTVGPMRAAFLFVRGLQEDGLIPSVSGIRCELFGSLGATGHGHGSVKAVVLGLEGEEPDRVDPVAAQPRVDAVRAQGRLRVAGEHPITFDMDSDIVLHRRKRLDFHTNGMLFQALHADGSELRRREYYSIGGGFVVDQDEAGRPAIVEDATKSERRRPLCARSGQTRRQVPHVEYNTRRSVPWIIRTVGPAPQCGHGRIGSGRKARRLSAISPSVAWGTSCSAIRARRDGAIGLATRASAPAFNARGNASTSRDMTITAARGL